MKYLSQDVFETLVTSVNNGLCNVTLENVWSHNKGRGKGPHEHRHLFNLMRNLTPSNLHQRQRK